MNIEEYPKTYINWSKVKQTDPWKKKYTDGNNVNGKNNHNKADIFKSIKNVFNTQEDIWQEILP